MFVQKYIPTLNWIKVAPRIEPRFISTINSTILYMTDSNNIYDSWGIAAYFV